VGFEESLKNGVMECWTVGNAPLLQHSITPPPQLCDFSWSENGTEPRLFDKIGVYKDIQQKSWSTNKQAMGRRWAIAPEAAGRHRRVGTDPQLRII
jgi:hypothetical protein